MGKIFALIGRSASGKSTIEKNLEQKGYKRIISNTTRPVRENERKDIDYHYLTEKQFNKVQEQLIEHTTYRGWNYGITKEDIKDIDKQDYICVIEPDGLIQIQNALGRNKIVPIYIYSTEYERLSRSILRQPQADANAYKEICRRFLSDYDTFNTFEKNKLYKYRIHNIDINQSVHIIEKIIEYEDELELLTLPDIPIGSIVKVVKIKNHNAGKHLIRHIGHAYKTLNYIWPSKKQEKRYKLLINDETQETAYFRRSELEIIKEE